MMDAMKSLPKGHSFEVHNCNIQTARCYIASNRQTVTPGVLYRTQTLGKNKIIVTKSR